MKIIIKKFKNPKTGKDIYRAFKKSSKNGKMYDVYEYKNGKMGKYITSFGSTDYENFKDDIGLHPKLIHGDEERRKNYLARAKGIKDKQGNKTWNDVNSANFYSVKFLW